jgi:nitric oxide reductase activation protein
MCLNALNEYIPNSSYYLDSYLINMSDGYPTFEKCGNFTYRGDEAILDTAKAVKNIKKKGVKILSYFIQTPTTHTKEEELIKNFQIMYGKEASFIDPKNMHEVTKTLNNLFLKQNLVS